VHRPLIDWSKMDRRTDATTVEGQIFARLLRLIELRKQTTAFSGNDMQVAPLRNDHVFGFIRSGGGQRVLVLANFTERPQFVDANEVRLYGLDYAFQELIGGSAILLDGEEICLQPYQVMWLLAG
jgi:amylosucrase